MIEQRRGTEIRSADDELHLPVFTSLTMSASAYSKNVQAQEGKELQFEEVSIAACSEF